MKIRSEALNSKNRITDAQSTVVQKFNIAASRNRAVFDFGAPFLASTYNKGTRQYAN